MPPVTRMALEAVAEHVEEVVVVVIVVVVVVVVEVVEAMVVDIVDGIVDASVESLSDSGKVTMAQVMTAVVNTSTVETEATIRIPLTFIIEEGLDFLQN